MTTITHRNAVPPGGGWIYIQPESGLAFKHPDLNRVKEMVKAHRKANNYPIGINFNQEIEDWICTSRPELCSENTPLAELTFFQRVSKFAAASINWAASGFRVTTAEQYHQRLSICQACEYFNGESVLGLGSCQKCGCSGLKLFSAVEHCPINKWNKI